LKLILEHNPIDSYEQQHDEAIVEDIGQQDEQFQLQDVLFAVPSDHEMMQK